MISVFKKSVSLIYQKRKTMRVSVKKSEINEVVENLNNGIQYANEAAGWSYSKGSVMMKMTADGKMKFYSTIEEMARAIVKSIKTGE